MSKSYQKKKAYRRMCLEMARKGYVPEPGGKFVPANMSTNHQHYLAGYKVSR